MSPMQMSQAGTQQMSHHSSQKRLFIWVLYPGEHYPRPRPRPTFSISANHRNADQRDKKS